MLPIYVLHDCQFCMRLVGENLFCFRSVHGAGQECCYDRSGVLLEDRLDDTGFGYAHRAFFAGDEESPRPGQIPFYSHFFEDVIPEMQCCKFPAIDPSVSQDDAAASCARYGSVRPSRSCSEYRIPNLGWYRKVMNKCALKVAFECKSVYLRMCVRE